MAKETQTGGRPATTGVIPGQYALSVGKPNSDPPSGWQWVLLTDVARLESGHTPSRKHPEYWGGNVPWIGIKDATENHGRIIGDTYQHTNELGIANSSARILPKNTICLSRTASVGYVVVMGRPMATSQDFVNWVCSDSIDHQFLKYVLLAERESFLRFASGTTHQTIYFPEVKAFHICLPPMNEQRVIAHILGSVDDKIELNRRMNATLEATARALFKSWFVDFDPVHYKARGEQPPGMDAETAALFPDSFEDSELGLIPAGWTVEPLPKVIDFLEGPGIRNWQYTNSDEGTKFINIRCIQDRDLDLETANRVTNQEASGKYKHFMLKADDMIVSTSGTLGRFAIVRSEHLPLMLNTSVIRMRPVESASTKEYIWGYIESNAFQEDLEALASGSVQRNFGPIHLKQMKLLCPPIEVLESYSSIAESIYRKSIQNRAENDKLAETRDTLLPKLVSGDLRVGDV